MNYSEIGIALQEVPGEISICFSITGCNLHCKGCHSPFLWNKKSGTELSRLVFEKTLNKYKGLATCILFMGGEWYENELLLFLKIARKKGFKTCLYSGKETINNKIKSQLTWLKLGPWMQNKGGLESKNTNQKFIEVKSNKILNHLFLKN